jgi:predicted HTH domain antitoxin
MAENAENFDLAHWELRQLVASGQYADERAALRSALRALFQRAPERKIRMVISAYEAGEIGLGKAATLLGVPQEEMKEILCEAGATIHLGPRTVEELHDDVRNA